MVPAGVLHHPSPASPPPSSSPQLQGEGGRMGVEEQVDSFRGKDQLSVSIQKQEQTEDENNANCAILVDDTVQATTSCGQSHHEENLSDSCEIVNTEVEQQFVITNNTGSQIDVYQKESSSPEPANNPSSEHQTSPLSQNYAEHSSDIISSEDLHTVNQTTTNEILEESPVNLTKNEIEAISLQLILEQIIERVIDDKVAIESFESAYACKDTELVSQQIEKEKSSRIFGNDEDVTSDSKVSENINRTAEIIPDQTQNDSCSQPPAAVSDAVTLDPTGCVANQIPLHITKIQELNGGEKEGEGNGWLCTICTTSFVNVDAYHIHLHQYHANPNLLTIEQVNKFKISNYLTTHKLTAGSEEDHQLLYRCHECFAIMGTAAKLRDHLVNHSKQPINHTAKEQQPLKAVAAVIKRRKNGFVGKKMRRVGDRKENKNGRHHIVRELLGVAKGFASNAAATTSNRSYRTRPQRSAAMHQKLARLQQQHEEEEDAEMSDEFNSNSENESDLSNRSISGSKNLAVSTAQPTNNRRPQRECKSRTKTLVAISLAEQDYDKFDLDFGKFKTDVASKTLESDPLKCQKKADLQEGATDLQHLKQQQQHEPEISSELVSNDLNKPLEKLDNTVDDSKESNSNKSALNVKEAKRSTRETKPSKKRGALRNSKPSQTKPPSASEVASSPMHSNLSTSISGGGGKVKSPGFNLKDRKKVGRLVADLVRGGQGDYVCLTCDSAAFQSYEALVAHKRKCSDAPSCRLMAGGEIERLKPKKNADQVVVKMEALEPTDELSKYITESVFKVPETTFNNMHGKLNDLKTEDASKYQNNCPNALGLVRMNYSGQWTAKDVWETAGWQPKDDQLSWQSYEVLASVNSDLEAFEKSNHPEEKNETDSGQQQLDCAISIETSSTNGVLEATPQVLANKTSKNFSNNSCVTRLSSSGNVTPSPKGREGLRLTSHHPPPPPPSPSAAAITRKLTSQISDRQRPVISNIQVQRDFLLKLSAIPWAEQRRVKHSFDSTLTPKKSKKAEKQYFASDAVSHQQLKQLTAMPSRLELRQVARSVKHTKNRSRVAALKSSENYTSSSVKKDKTDSTIMGRDGKEHTQSNTLAGEWEMEHTFLCSVCGIEYDDMVEIMHHKWEAHPHCLVAHVCLKHNLQRPPALLFPQVGPSTVPNTLETSKPSNFSCSKCDQKFSTATDFHSHILLCGGLAMSEISPTKKRRRKGHGGGLKSTVRMIKKSSQTDENSPRKKLRPPPRDFSNVPLVPTHSRTTRFKESKQKEAKLLKAKQAKEKSRRGRRNNSNSRQQLNQPKNRTKIAAASHKRGSLIDREVKRVVRNLLDQVEGGVKVEKEGTPAKVGISQKEKPSSTTRRRASSLPEAGKITTTPMHPPPRRSSRKILRQQLTEEETNLSNRDAEQNIEIADSMLDFVFERVFDDLAKRIVHKANVRVSVFNDDIVPRITNHENLIPSASLSNRSSPLKRSRSNSIDISGDDSIASSLSPAAAASSRIHKRLQSDLSEKLMPHENLTKKQRRATVSRSTSPAHRTSSTRRNIFPLDLKVSVLDRIEFGGETISTVSADVDIPVGIVARWWLAKDELREKLALPTAGLSSNSGSVSESMKAAFSNSNEKHGRDGVKGVEGICKAIVNGFSGPTSPSKSANLSVHHTPEKDRHDSDVSPSRKKRKAKVLTLSDIFNEDGSLIRPKSSTGSSANDDKKMKLDNDNTIHEGESKAKFDEEIFNLQKENDVGRQRSRIQRSTREKADTEMKVQPSLSTDLRDAGDESPELNRDGEHRKTPKRGRRGRRRKRSEREDTTNKSHSPQQNNLHVVHHQQENQSCQIVNEKLINEKGSDLKSKHTRGRIENYSETSEIGDRESQELGDSILELVNSDDELKAPRNSTPTVQESESSALSVSLSANCESSSGGMVSASKLSVDSTATSAATLETSERKRPTRRRQSTLLSSGSHASSPSLQHTYHRQFMPLEVKQEAIQRICKGESQVCVAKDLDVSVSTISSWWRKKEILLNGEQGSGSATSLAGPGARNDTTVAGSGGVGDDNIEDQTIEELVQMEVDEKKSNTLCSTSCKTAKVGDTDSSLDVPVRAVDIINEISSSVPSVILELAPPMQEGSKTNKESISMTSDEKVSNESSLNGCIKTNSDHSETRSESEHSGGKESDKGETSSISIGSLKAKDLSMDTMNNTENVESSASSISDKDSDTANFTPLAKTDLLKSMKLAFNNQKRLSELKADSTKENGFRASSKEDNMLEASTQLLDQIKSVTSTKENLANSEINSKGLKEENENKYSEVKSTPQQSCNSNFEELANSNNISRSQLPFSSNSLEVTKLPTAPSPRADRSDKFPVVQPSIISNLNLMPVKKKKSLELLANTLMEKALAHTTTTASSPQNTAISCDLVSSSSCQVYTAESSLEKVDSSKYLSSHNTVPPSTTCGASTSVREASASASKEDT